MRLSWREAALVCSEDVVGSAAGTAAPKKTDSGGAPGGTTLRVTILLALLLVLVGVAGAGALNLLEHAMRLPTADDTAQLVCTAFQRQDYSLLIQQIDPTPVPPGASEPFDPATLRSQLTALDANEGTVKSCTYTKLNTGAATPLQYTYTLHRSRLAAPITLIVLMQQVQDGTWKITRGSNLIGTQSQGG